MPIYEYRCQDCDYEFERMQKFSDPPLEDCPSCDGDVQKLISRSTFHLKGDGWYVTDYARKSGSNGSSNDSSDSSKSDTSSQSETSSESKASSTSTSKTDSSSKTSSTTTSTSST